MSTETAEPPTAELSTTAGTVKSLAIRTATVEDGRAVWSLVRSTGILDLNSVYSYILLFDRFQDTCLVAEQDGRVVGFVSAFKPPTQPKTVFVWQIGVDASARGQGVGGRLLERLLRLPACREVAWLETNVTPSNGASQALFRSLAKRLGVGCEVGPGYDGELFQDGKSDGEPAHEPEELYRIGPIPTPSTSKENS